MHFCGSLYVTVLGTEGVTPEWSMVASDQESKDSVGSEQARTTSDTPYWSSRSIWGLVEKAMVSRQKNGIRIAAVCL